MRHKDVPDAAKGYLCSVESMICSNNIFELDVLAYLDVYEY